MKLKEAYFIQAPTLLKSAKEHDDQVERCDLDLTKPAFKKQTTKTTMRKRFIERDQFLWGPEQDLAFCAIKDAILHNLVTGADPKLQFHLAVDASLCAIGGVLFQMPGVSTGEEATPKFRMNERIILFLSF